MPILEREMPPLQAKIKFQAYSDNLVRMHLGKALNTTNYDTKLSTGKPSTAKARELAKDWAVRIDKQFPDLGFPRLRTS